MTFDEVIQMLQAGDANDRIEAARMLADNQNDLSDDEYRTAVRALQTALADPDPQVIMVVMEALSRFTRETSEMQAVTSEDDDAEELVTVATCSVCGKPEVLVDPSTCEYENCPYK